MAVHDSLSDFETSLVGKECQVSRREHDWVFLFGSLHDLVVACPWRLVSSEGIGVSDEDHDQLFGLRRPVDAAERANDLLRGSMIVSATVDRTTADLCLRFSNGWRLDVFNNSSGYEGWTAEFSDDAGRLSQLIGMGGGAISIF